MVTYSESDPKVLVSLRQADILKALANDEELSTKGGCVPELQEVGSFCAMWDVLSELGERHVRIRKIREPRQASSIVESDPRWQTE